MRSNYLKCFVLFVVCVMNVAVFAGAVKKSLKVVNGKVVLYSHYGNSGYFASHRNLCGPNEQMGVDTFEYSTECCEKNDDGVCVSEKSCRRAKAVCLDKDKEGKVVGSYDSYGVKDCGACTPSLDNPAEVVGPGF